MITIRPIRKVLVPINTLAAQRISGPNYDEFQNDSEIYQFIKANPDSILRITMPHCNVSLEKNIMLEGSKESLDHAAHNMEQLIKSNLTHILNDILFIYEIEDKNRLGVRQIGLGGMAKTCEIRTDTTPTGSIIRNEGIKEAKARGRVDLIKRTRANIGIVNNAIEDREGKITTALETYADSIGCDYYTIDANSNIHKIWLLTEVNIINKFINLFRSEPCAYVADGNHRSAASAMLGQEEFLAVFFNINQMGIAPYNRLIKKTNLPVVDLGKLLKKSFEVEKLGNLPEFQPNEVHDIGLYTNNMWYKLKPKKFVYDSASAVESIDADIVQKNIFNEIFSIRDNGDSKLTFVGGNKSAAYLKQKVDNGHFEYAITLAPVTIKQFVTVCKHNHFMPPKSTWFEPKVCSGLIIALMD